MEPPVVLVIGCGISGPVIALFLKKKGYRPIVFEKVRELGDVGASMVIMSNGLRVLARLGLADELKNSSPHLQVFWDGDGQGDKLGQADCPREWADRYGQPAVGLRRSALNLLLYKKIREAGIEVRTGWTLQDLEEHQSSVTAYFNEGRVVKGSFIVACDGIKSATRDMLLRKKGISTEAPTFLHLTQITGLSQTPETYRNSSPALRQWYGEGAHVLCYPTSETHTSWVINMPEMKESRETWHPCPPSEEESQKVELLRFLQGWDPELLELIRTAGKLTRFGSFDRQELEPGEWYSSRCVLVGDAVHPMSTHVGQGANQSLQDCARLNEYLPTLNPARPDYEANLSIVNHRLAEATFRPYSEVRQPQTSALAKISRQTGSFRIVKGRENCERRNRIVVQRHENNSLFWDRMWDSMLRAGL